MTKEEVLATYTKLQAQAQSNEETPVNTSGTVIIGDDIITDTVELNTPGTPSEEDYLFVIKVPAAGGKKEYVKYTVAELLASLGAEVTDAKDAVTEMKSDIIDIQADITQKVATIEGYPEQIEQKTEESIETIDTEKQSAVDTINTEEQSALSAIDSAKESALDAIGESDTEGARGNAIESINFSKESALDSIDAQKESALTELNGKMHVGYREMIGDGSSTTFIITHNLGCQWVLCQVWFTDLGAKYYHSIHELDNNRIQIDFNYPPPASSVDVRIVPNIRLEEGGGSLPDDFLITQEHIDDSVECTQSDVADLIAILG